MPGIVDAHTHLSVRPGLGDQLGRLRQEPGRQALRVPDNLRADLDAGTTTLRIMAEEDWLDVHVRDAIEAGELEGPRLVIATRGITASNGHGRAKSAFDGPDAIRRGARENFAHGADFLKVFATGGVSSGSGLNGSVFSVAEMRAAVEEAERAGSYVAAHAHGGPGLQAAVEAGIHTIEHAATASDDDVQAMLDHDCWVVGTYTILFHPDGIERGDAGNPQVLAALRAGARARDHAGAGRALVRAAVRARHRLDARADGVRDPDRDPLRRRAVGCAAGGDRARRGAARRPTAARSSRVGTPT